jgi:hypothetical protein
MLQRWLKRNASKSNVDKNYISSTEFFGMQFYILAAEVFVRLLLTTIAFVSCCLCESHVRVGASPWWSDREIRRSAGRGQGWIQHDLVGGGGALPALVPSCVGHVCCPPINLLHYCKILLDYCIWIVIVVHSSLIIMLLLKLLYLILSLIIFCFIMKNSTPPCTPSDQG